MKRNSGGIGKILLIVFAVLLIAGGGVFSYFRWFREKKEPVEISSLLLETDYALENGFYSEAADILEESKGYSGNSRNWLRILRRADSLSRGVEDYSILSAHAGHAVKDLPGNEELHAIYTYALLRENRYEDAYSHALKHLESKRYQSLIAEAALYLDPDQYDSDELSDNEYRSLLGGDMSGDPMLFEELARRYQDDSLFAAGAVIWMLNGSVEQAVQNIVEIDSSDYSLLKYFIYYDYGEFDTALAYLQELKNTSEFQYEEALLLEADLYMAQNKYDTAAGVYLKVIETAPESSWIPYLNLAWIHTRGMDYEAAADALIRGYDLFPGKKEVAAAFSIFLLQVTRINLAEDVLQKLETGLADHEEMLRVYHQAIQASKSPERYKTILWELFTMHPDNMKIAQYFAWYLIGLKDMDDLSLVIKKSEERFGKMEWIDFFNGMVQALQGKMSTSREYFLQALEKNDRWETAYNLALLSLQSGDSDKALDYFRRAESKLMKDTAAYGTTIAQIRVKMAWILYVNDQFEAAKRQISYALELDGDNLEGQLLRKKLEAEIKR